jgi:hypothetical protein
VFRSARGGGKKQTVWSAFDFRPDLKIPLARTLRGHFVPIFTHFLEIVLTWDVCRVNERVTHMDERGIHTDERGIHTDERGIHTDERGIHMDERGIQPDGKRVKPDAHAIRPLRLLPSASPLPAFSFPLPARLLTVPANALDSDMARTSTKSSPDSTANLGFEAKLWLAADKLRNNMDAAEYKHVVLGLIFLKYISDTFEEHRAKLLAGEGDYAGANPEDPDEYKAENVFWVPADARWSHLQASAKQPTIGKTVDDAMVAIERDNPRLKGVLPKDYARPGLDKHRLGELIDLIGGIDLIERAPSPQPSPSGRGSEKAHYRGGYDFSGLLKLAREMRKKQTPAEDLLWELLRDRQLCNAKFRRQHQFGDYLCDFYCHDAELVVECDGAPHSKPDQIKHDAKRDAFL